MAELKKQMPERMAGQLGQHHSEGLRRERAETKAERILGEKLQRLRWKEAALACRRETGLSMVNGMVKPNM